MREVQKIACINNAGFVLWFEALCDHRASRPSGSFPINQVGVIDLGATPFPTGIEIRLRVHAVLGQTKAATERVVFRMNGQTAVYEVKGTTQHYSIKLVGGP
jgi:hypothetical protein